MLSGESPPESLKSLKGFVRAVRVIEFMPRSVPGLGWLLLIFSGIVSVRYLNDPALLSVTVLPQLRPSPVTSLFLDDLDAYYYLSLMPATVLTFVLAVTAMPSARFARATTVVTLVVALAFVPSVFAMRRRCLRMPQCRILVDARRGRSEVFGQPMQRDPDRLRTPPSSNAEFLFEVLGGTIDRRAPWICVIRANGDVTFSQVPASRGTFHFLPRCCSCRRRQSPEASPRRADCSPGRCIRAARRRASTSP